MSTKGLHPEHQIETCGPNLNGSLKPPPQDCKQTLAEAPGRPSFLYPDCFITSSFLFFRRFSPKIQETTMPTKYSSNMGVEKTSIFAMSEVGVRTAANIKMMRIA